MRHILKLAQLLALTGALLLPAGCGDDNPHKPGPPEGQVPDFSLTDVNPSSSTYLQAVSPRDHLGRVSAWYFGHST